MKKFKVNGREFSVGDSVTAEVPWVNGRRTTMEGKLISIVDDEAFLETTIGPVAAAADTLEPA